MRMVLLFALLAALAVSQTMARAQLKKRQAPDEDAERVVPRDPVLIIDSPRRFGSFYPDSVEDDESSDGDDFFGSMWPGFRRRPMLGDMEWLEMLQRRFAIMNELLDKFFNRRTQFPDGVGFGGFGDLPPEYDNSTYTTKVVNGSLVSVNETIKKHQSNSSTFFFHVKTIQVKPLNETEGVDGESVPSVDEAIPTSETRFREPTASPDDVADNDVNSGRRFKRFASELDVLERNLNNLARHLQ